MLKFSGFSDLTSCLWWNAYTARDAAPSVRTRKREAQSIVVAQGLDALNAPGTARRPDAQKLATTEHRECWNEKE
jgi:hypothetical protein